MAYQVYPAPAVVSGDPASQTVPAVVAGTYSFTTSMAAGTYEITTDTTQSSFTLILQSAEGYRYSGTIRGGKGYIVAASPVTKMVVPAGLTYPLNINARLGASTLIAAPTGASIAFTSAGGISTVTWTAPAGATDIVMYWRDGTNTSMATTSSPKTSVTLNGAVNGQPGYGVIVAKDSFGNIGTGVEIVTSTNAVIPIQGGTPTVVTDGSTSYLVNTFTGAGNLIVNAVSNIQYLVAAGGGAGATGGGGGGGVLIGTLTSAATGSFTVTVGAGGAGKSGTRSAGGLRGNQGGNSSIAFGTPLTAIGGGGGGMVTNVNTTYTSDQVGGNGGSGGGGGSNYNSGGSSAGGTGTSGQGFAGGNGQSDVGPGWGIGGGGGGAGAAGTNTSGDNGGNGGNGVSSSINGTATIRGGGGAGPKSRSGTAGTAGTGGGTAASTSNVGINAAALSSGGAGGVSGVPSPGYGICGSGGSGIVIVRVAI